MALKKDDINVEKRLQEFSGKKRFRFILGGICFVMAATFVMIHLGFMKEGDTVVVHKQFLTRQSLWLVNGGIGILGGILLDYRHPLISALSGLVANLAITGAALLYLSWRDSIINAEIILPMFAGVLGVLVYKSLIRNQVDEPTELNP